MNGWTIDDQRRLDRALQRGDRRDAGAAAARLERVVAAGEADRILATAPHPRA